MVYATALWLVGRDGALRDLADPEKDAQALAQEISVISSDNLRAITRADKHEAALFAFLAEQAEAPNEERLRSRDLRLDEATSENLGLLVLLLAITVEPHASLEAITTLNRFAGPTTQQ